jgi:hypothetical protein
MELFIPLGVDVFLNSSVVFLEMLSVDKLVDTFLVNYEVLTETSINVNVLGAVAPCILVED